VDIVAGLRSAARPAPSFPERTPHPALLSAARAPADRRALSTIQTLVLRLTVVIERQQDGKIAPERL
jgi:hypothetical protein